MYVDTYEITIKTVNDETEVGQFTLKNVTERNNSLDVYGLDFMTK